MINLNKYWITTSTPKNSKAKMLIKIITIKNFLPKLPELVHLILKNSLDILTGSSLNQVLKFFGSFSFLTFSFFLVVFEIFWVFLGFICSTCSTWSILISFSIILFPYVEYVHYK
ncbi:hypothetical protein MSCa_7230 [Mycoplasma mycoides subsp. mycoides PO-67]|nr:hypothetical protein MSCa_7230 [Mycoplasma mycoides subsp. mycoides PO-67]